jgi:hypothetical protein
VNAATPVPPSAEQLVTGEALVPQHVPREVSVEPPPEVTVPPMVARLIPMEVAVGDVTVGTSAFTVNVCSVEETAL